LNATSLLSEPLHLRLVASDVIIVGVEREPVHAASYS